MGNKNLEELKSDAEMKSYAHFDYRVCIKDCWDYISKPENIAKHSFYPFILDERKKLKVHKDKKANEGKFEIKTRPICYSAHLDRCIFQYYSFLFNEKYNQFVESLDVNKCAIAYRTNLSGKTNIHFAYDAFSFLKKTEHSYIIIGDFEDFFGSLNHLHLKNMLRQVLKCKNLTDDIYAVYKNITHYSTWAMEDIITLNKEQNSSITKKVINNKSLALSKELFSRFVKTNIVEHADKGIPQGSAISAVLSNIYMIDFDKQISALVNSINGKYLRYSDDFILILPKINEQSFIDCYNILKTEISKNFLVLQPNKTQIYKFENDEIVSCENLVGNENSNSKKINYLGFSFDGKNVWLKDKTISKYYNKLNRKIKFIKTSNFVTKKGHKISCKNLYRVYSKVGSKHNQAENKWGNFITYSKKCEEIFKEFGENNKTNLINKRHMQQINKKLKAK